MTDQPRIPTGSARDAAGSLRHPLSGSSLLLVLFVLAALPPASFAESLPPQAVLELLASSHEAPKREAPRELRALKGWVTVLATPTRPWLTGPAARLAALRDAAFDLRPLDIARASQRVDQPATLRAHVRAHLHDLPPPRQ
jgi:hypothetical protein